MLLSPLQNIAFRCEARCLLSDISNPTVRLCEFMQLVFSQRATKTPLHNFATIVVFYAIGQIQFSGAGHIRVPVT